MRGKEADLTGNRETARAIPARVGFERNVRRTLRRRRLRRFGKKTFSTDARCVSWKCSAYLAGMQPLHLEVKVRPEPGRDPRAGRAWVPSDPSPSHAVRGQLAKPRLEPFAPSRIQENRKEDVGERRWIGSVTKRTRC